MKKSNFADIRLKRIIIIGAGFGGIKLAKELKKINYQILLIDKHNYHCFQPLMYQVASSVLEGESIVYPIRKIFHRQKNLFFRLGNVTEIDADQKKIYIDDRSISYDILVIASGARSNFFKNEGLIISAMPMKTVDEALDLRSLILQNFEKALLLKNLRKKESLINFVIAGAGPTGVELAGALGELKKHVLPKDFPELNIQDMGIYLVQAGDRVLPMLSEKSSERAKKYLEKLGVTVILNTRVLDFHGDYVQTDTDQDIIAKTLIWTAGVEGAPINGLNHHCIVKNNRIQVDNYNRVISYNDVYAIGDVAAMIQPDTPNGHPMVAPAAIQQGKHLAKNLKRITKGQEPLPFVYKDKGSMATIGKNKAVVEFAGMKFGGFFAWLIWMTLHLFSLVGFRNKLVAMINWIKGYVSSDKNMRVIIRPFNLMDVKRRRKKQYQDKQSEQEPQEPEVV